MLGRPSVAFSKFAALTTVLALGLLGPKSAGAQQVEDDYYEAFDANAAPLAFRDPPPADVEYYSNRTNRLERRRIDSNLLDPPNGLEFYLFRVGQADSMLVVGPAPQRRTMLVDLGVSKDQGLGGRYSAQHVGQRIIDITGRRRVDYFMLSHFHSDHFGSGDSGITALVGHGGFSIGTIIDTGPLGTPYLKRAAGATEYIARQAGWISSGKVTSVERPRFGTGQIDLGPGVAVDIVAFAGQPSAPDEGVHARYQRAHPGHYTANPASENDLSIAMEISLGNFEFWTAGDLSGASGNGKAALSGSNHNYTNVEYPMTRAWVSSGLDRDVEVYRANHHGSGYSSTPQLLASLDPEVVLYSALSGHGHPTVAAVDRAGTTVAVQYATGIDPEKWMPATFATKGGKVLDEIQLFVAPDGGSYTIDGKAFRAFSDQEEKAGADQAP